jgi:hypothetical protein
MQNIMARKVTDGEHYKAAARCGATACDVCLSVDVTG